MDILTTTIGLGSLVTLTGSFIGIATYINTTFKNSILLEINKVTHGHDIEINKLSLKHESLHSEISSIKILLEKHLEKSHNRS